MAITSTEIIDFKVIHRDIISAELLKKSSVSRLDKHTIRIEEVNKGEGVYFVYVTWKFKIVNQGKPDDTIIFSLIVETKHLAIIKGGKIDNDKMLIKLIQDSYIKFVSTYLNEVESTLIKSYKFNITLETMLVNDISKEFYKSFEALPK